MFQIAEQTALISSVSIGAEMHGEERVPACYVDFSMDIGAEILDEFASGLRGAFYVKPRQQRLEGVEDADGPRLRFDGLLAPLKLKKEYAGYVVRVVWGDLAGSVDFKLADSKIKKFVAEPKAGGSCGLSFQVQAHPDQNGYGVLAMLVQKEVKVTLEPPKADETPKSADSPPADSANSGDAPEGK